jgi:hypothetical protein
LARKIAAGTVASAPAAMSVLPTRRDCDSLNRLEINNPMPAASMARVATMKPNLGGLNTISFMTHLRAHAVQASCGACARPAKPRMSLPLSESRPLTIKPDHAPDAGDRAG